jgi:hypothetical protein
MTVCRHCGVPIVRAAEDDVRVASCIRMNPDAMVNIVTEAWVGDGWLFCTKGAPIIRWHEPVLESPAEMVDALKKIEIDLR